MLHYNASGPLNIPLMASHVLHNTYMYLRHALLEGLYSVGLDLCHKTIICRLFVCVIYLFIFILFFFVALATFCCDNVFFHVCILRHSVFTVYQ